MNLNIMDTTRFKYPRATRRGSAIGLLHTQDEDVQDQNQRKYAGHTGSYMDRIRQGMETVQQTMEETIQNARVAGGPGAGGADREAGETQVQKVGAAISEKLQNLVTTVAPRASTNGITPLPADWASMDDDESLFGESNNQAWKNDALNASIGGFGAPGMEFQDMSFSNNSGGDAFAFDEPSNGKDGGTNDGFSIIPEFDSAVPQFRTGTTPPPPSRKTVRSSPSTKQSKATDQKDDQESSENKGEGSSDKASSRSRRSTHSSDGRSRSHSKSRSKSRTRSHSRKNRPRKRREEKDSQNTEGQSETISRSRHNRNPTGKNPDRTSSSTHSRRPASFRVGSTSQSNDGAISQSEHAGRSLGRSRSFRNNLSSSRSARHLVSDPLAKSAHVASRGETRNHPTRHRSTTGMPPKLDEEPAPLKNRTQSLRVPSKARPSERAEGQSPVATDSSDRRSAMARSRSLRMTRSSSADRSRSGRSVDASNPAGGKPEIRRRMKATDRSESVRKLTTDMEQVAW